MILCAGNNEIFPFARPIGVGLIQSSINLTTICQNQKPKELLFVGSAGSYGNHNIFDIIQCKNASNIELSSLSKDSYTPIQNIIKNDDKQIVNSSNYISVNDSLSKEFLKQNITLENMEYFAVVSVAQKFNIDVNGIFVVTNYTNKNAHNDFIKNHKKAKELLIKYLEKKGIV